MIDNLRRTLSAPLSLATLVVAWTVPSVPAGPWTALVLASVIIPAAVPVAAGLLPRRAGISKRSHLRAVGADVALAAIHVGLGFTFLAHQAWLMGDAIVRAVVRLYVTHRNLLEWMTAAQAGHLYNWYDTRDLHPLEPAYVSSVDSGNLAGHLLALSSACRQMIDQPLPVAAALEGIRDTVALARQAAETIGHDRKGQTLTRRHLEEALAAFDGTDEEIPATMDAWADRIATLTARARILSDVAAALSAERGEGAAGEP